jgi:putative transposase
MRNEWALALGLTYACRTMKYAPQEMRTYSMTAVTAGRRRLFQVETTAELFIETLQNYRSKGNFELYSFVAMPDHIHLLLTPAPTVPLEKAMQLIKGGFSFRLKSKLDVWDPGSFDRRIVDRAAFDECKRYIELNPVRARIVSEAEDYPYSSLRRPDMIDPRPPWFGGKSQG